MPKGFKPISEFSGAIAGPDDENPVTNDVDTVEDEVIETVLKKETLREKLTTVTEPYDAETLELADQVLTEAGWTKWDAMYVNNVPFDFKDGNQSHHVPSGVMRDVYKAIKLEMSR